MSEFFVYIKPAGSYGKFRAYTIPRTISDNSTYFKFGPTPYSRLAAARSRRGSDSPPDCHSIPRRRFATLEQGGETFWCGLYSLAV